MLILLEHSEFCGVDTHELGPKSRDYPLGERWHPNLPVHPRYYEDVSLEEYVAWLTRTGDTVSAMAEPCT